MRERGAITHLLRPKPRFRHLAIAYMATMPRLSSSEASKLRLYSIAFDETVRITPATDDCGAGRAPLLDIRLCDAIEVRRLKGSVNLPHTEWLQRRMELPPRGHKFAILYDSIDAGSVRECKDISSRFSEDVIATIDAQAIDWENGSIKSAVESGPYPGSIQPRLWFPGPLVAELVERIKAGEWLSVPPSEDDSVTSCASQPITTTVSVLDAGSGMGRNAVFLAQELPRALTGSCGTAPSVLITAVDNRRLLAELLTDFAKRLGVEDRVKPIVSEFDAIIDQYSSSTKLGDEATGNSNDHRGFDIVLFARFMDKPSLRRIETVIPRHSPALLCVEHFHASADHPSDPAQKISEEEVLALVQSSAGKSHDSRAGGTSPSSASADVRACDAHASPAPHWEVLLERRTAAEDGRPLLQTVLRHTPEAHTASS